MVKKIVILQLLNYRGHQNDFGHKKGIDSAGQKFPLQLANLQTAEVNIFSPLASKGALI